MLSAAHAVLIDGRPAPSTAGFAAGRFVLRDVYQALVAAGDAPDPHPLTSVWRDELGLDLTDSSAADQLAWLQRTPLYTYAGRHRLLTGVPLTTPPTPTRLESLARPLAPAPATAVTIATQRTTPDHAACLHQLTDWLALP
jgi:hypothetical protein